MTELQNMTFREVEICGKKEIKMVWKWQCGTETGLTSMRWDTWWKGNKRQA